MSEGAAAPSGGAPSSAPAGGAPAAPSGVQPGSHTDAPARGRVSDFETAMEARNARLSERRTQQAVENTQRSLQDQQPGLRDPREKGVDGDELYGFEAPAELDDGDPRQKKEPELEKPGDEGKALDDKPLDRDERMFAPEPDRDLLDATKAWLAGTGDMPEAFKNQVHEWVDKNTGAVRRMTIGEMQEGVLRQSDYSSKMNELRGFQQQVQWQQQANNQFWQNIREPQQLLEELEDRGYSETFHRAAVEYSNRRMKMKQVAEAAGYALMQQYGYQQNHPDVVNAVRQAMQQQQQNYAIQVENRKLMRHNQMLAQQQQQHQQRQQQQVRMQDLSASITPLIPNAFKSVGVRNSPANTEALYRHLNAYLSTVPNWDGNIRRGHVTTAAKMVREELEDLAAARRPKQAAAPSRALPPGRLGQSGNAQPAQRERGRPSEFEERVMSRG